MRAWIERQRCLIDFSVANLGRRKARNLGLLGAYILLVFLLASVVLYGDALRHEARLLLADAPDIVVQRLSAGRHDLIAADRLDALRALRGVRHADGRLWGYHYDPTLAANTTLQVPLVNPPGVGETVLGATLARARGLNPSDTLALRGDDGQIRAFRITGLLSSDSELVSADLMLVNEFDYRAFFGTPAGFYTDLALTVGNPKEAGKIAEKILTRLPGSRVILKDEMRRTYDAVFNWRQGLLLTFLGTLLAAFALLAWDKASGLSAEERREIGILKAIGWETGDVMRMKFWEGALLSTCAFLAGYVLAYLHVFHGGGALFEPILKGWSVLYPKFTLTPQIDLMQLASLFFLSVLPYTAATLAPVWRAATLDPDEVMRE
jgi:lipoprotein-releasing system permease protein